MRIKKVVNATRNNNSLILNSDPYPNCRVEVYDGNGGECRFTINDVYSKTEYVLVVVTADGTNLKMYKCVKFNLIQPNIYFESLRPGAGVWVGVLFAYPLSSDSKGFFPTQAKGV